VNSVIIRSLGICHYDVTLKAMQRFTKNRTDTTLDELWQVEHESVFTQGQAGDSKHILDSGPIPVVQSDRGGQVTYHGPGQLVVYLLLDIRRQNLTVRKLVTAVEQAVIDYLAMHKITGTRKDKAPGVYVGNSKICSLGFRIKAGFAYHGFCLNVNMDLEPYSRIRPCGLSNISTAQLYSLGGPDNVALTFKQILPFLKQELGYD